MKKLLSILLLFVCQLAQSQTVPQGINYQAVAVDQRGQPIPGIDIVGRPIDDAEIGVRIAILENTPTGNILYQEEHEVLTDLYGMFNLVIGQGLQVSVDPFSSINWQGDKFLQVELSIENNGEYVLSAVQQLMSVPYAFLAENAMVAQTAVDVDDADADPSNELQSLSVSGDSLTLSNGNTVQLPAIDDADADPNNEIQVLSISNDTLYLSNGGYAVLPTDQVNDADADPSNEIQTLTKSGSTISLTNGGSVTVFDGDYNNLSNTPSIPTKTSDLTNDSGFLITEVDGSTTNELQVLSLSNDTIYLTSGGFVVLPTGFDGDYNNLTNTPTIPGKTSDLTNDSGFITGEVDGSTTNELQLLSMSNDTLYLTDGGFVVLPSGFNGDYNNLTNTPAIPSKTSDLTNDSGFITTEQDSSITNELQSLSISNDTLFLTNGGFVVLSNLSGSSNGMLFNSTIAIDEIVCGGWGSVNCSNTNYPGSVSYTVPQGETWIIENIFWDNSSTFGCLNPRIIVNGVLVGRAASFSSEITLGVGDVLTISGHDSRLNSNCPGNTELLGRVLLNGKKYLSSNNSISALSVDNDSTNELQTLSISNDTIFLTDGGFVKLPFILASNSNFSSADSISMPAAGNLWFSTSLSGSIETHYDTIHLGDWDQLLEVGEFRIRSGNGSVNSRLSIIDDSGNTIKTFVASGNPSDFNYSFATQGSYVVYKYEKLGGNQQLFERKSSSTQVFSKSAQQNTASASLPIDSVVPVNPISGQFWYDYENGQLKSYLNTPSSSKTFRLGQNMIQSSMGTNVSGSWTIYRLTSTQDIYSWGALEGDYTSSLSSSCSGEIKVYLDQDTLFTNGFGNEHFSRSSTPVLGGQTLSDLTTFSGLIEENTVIWIIVKHHSCGNQYAIQNFSQSIPTEFKDVNVFQSYYDPLIYYATNGFITAATRFPRVSFSYKNISLKWNVIKDFNETF